MDVLEGDFDSSRIAWEAQAQMDAQNEATSPMQAAQAQADTNSAITASASGWRPGR